MEAVSYIKFTDLEETHRFSKAGRWHGPEGDEGDGECRGMIRAMGARRHNQWSLEQLEKVQGWIRQSLRHYSEQITDARAVQAADPTGVKVKLIHNPDLVAETLIQNSEDATRDFLAALDVIDEAVGNLKRFRVDIGLSVVG